MWQQGVMWQQGGGFRWSFDPSGVTAKSFSLVLRGFTQHPTRQAAGNTSHLRGFITRLECECANPLSGQVRETYRCGSAAHVKNKFSLWFGEVNDHSFSLNRKLVRKLKCGISSSVCRKLSCGISFRAEKVIRSQISLQNLHASECIPPIQNVK